MFLSTGQGVLRPWASRWSRMVLQTAWVVEVCARTPRPLETIFERTRAEFPRAPHWTRGLTTV